MVRTNDPFWNYVEDMTDGSKKCTFCWHLFAKDTSISRIKWHLSGETGHGVGICGQVPKEVQEAAFLAMRGDNKIHKSTPSSSNVNDYTISTCPQDNGIHGNLVGHARRMQDGVQVRPNDPFWNYVEDMNDGSKMCKFCGHLFAKDTSISRIKWHLSEETGHGVGICGQVPKEVQEAAFLAMHGDSKIHKSTPSSSNVNDHAISTCPQDNGIHGNLVGDAGRMQVGVQVTPYDPFWNYVEDMNDGSKMCKFCGHLFAKDTSISRIKWHLSGETGHGVGICGHVPKEVQEAAFLAMHGDSKIHKSTPSSSNVNDYAISTCPQDNGIHGNLVGDAGRMQVGVQVRPNDPFWNYVEDMNDGSKMCKFCGHLFAKDTSISRIKWHLSGETGHGVGICGQVPKEVQEAAFLAMHGDSKIHKSTPSSSNVNDYAISTCLQDNGIHGNLVGDAGRMQVGVQVRPNDPFWNYVEDMNDGSKKCMFCGHLFAKDTSISRIKWHLSGETGHGVGICGQVPKEVQEAAFLAMRGDNKIHKSTPSSSNVNDYTISTCPQDNGIHGNLVGDARRMQDGVQVRPNDPFWNYVEDMNDGSKKCMFCWHLFAKDTSISRIKWHLSGETGHGVGICGQVPKEVQEAAFLAMRGGNNE